MYGFFVTYLTVKLGDGLSLQTWGTQKRKGVSDFFFWWKYYYTYIKIGSYSGLKNYNFLLEFTKFINKFFSFR